MGHYVHELTDIEESCGVTLEQVANELPRVAVRENGTVWVDADLPPALAGSVARAALGAPAEYLGMNIAGVRVYGPEQQ